MTMTSWGFLNYVRSRNVEKKQETNLLAALVAGRARQEFLDAVTNRTYNETEEELSKVRAFIKKKEDRYNRLHKAVPNRDSSMK